jgi:KRAB domain-containing zinc finger protein
MLKNEPSAKFVIQEFNVVDKNEINEEDIIEYVEEDDEGVLYDYLDDQNENNIDGNSFLIKQDVDKITRDIANDYLYRCSNRECKRNNVCFLTDIELDIHNSEVHLMQWKEGQCPICNRKLANRDKLKTHLELRHTPKLYYCDQCGRSFRSKDNLRLHMTHHRKYYSVQCRACKKTYKSIQSLRYHLRQHFEHHQCEACGKVFEHKKLLLGHVAAKHKQELQVQCRYCSRFFARSDVRDVHEKEIHKYGAVKSYFKCQECNQDFDLREDLTRHKILNHFSGVIHSCEVSFLSNV